MIKARLGFRVSYILNLQPHAEVAVLQVHGRQSFVPFPAVPAMTPKLIDFLSYSLVQIDLWFKVCSRGAYSTVLGGVTKWCENVAGT